MSETVILRTGIEAHRGLVLTISVALRTLLSEAPLAFFDAVMWARTGEPQPFSQARIEAVGLLQNGVMHQATREVIAASAEGEALDMVLVNPLRKEAS